ncbi:MAG: hypothetical protein AAFR98_00620 [Pseudomonadota bacterium]
MAHTHALRRTGFAARPSQSFMDRLIRLDDVLRERAALRRMDADQMRDLGLSHAEIKAELRTPFWRFL